MRRPDHDRDERGLTESLQWAVLTPLILLMVIGVVQCGIVLHGRTVAAHAALAGAEAQSVSGAGAGVGEQVAREVAERGGLLGVAISVSSGAEVEVVVTARVDSFMDLGAGRVEGRASMPGEVPR